MARQSAEKRLKAWRSRIADANKAYKNWSDDFRVDELEDIYTGVGQRDPEDEEKYIINKIFPTVEIGIRGDRARGREG